jgi:hypothetical protein
MPRLEDIKNHVKEIHKLMKDTAENIKPDNGVYGIYPNFSKHFFIINEKLFINIIERLKDKQFDKNIIYKDIKEIHKNISYDNDKSVFKNKYLKYNIVINKYSKYGKYYN